MFLPPSLKTERASGYQDSDYSPRTGWRFFLSTRPKSLSFTWRRDGDCLVRIWQRVRNLPLPSVLLANVQSLDNKMDELRSRLSYQWDIKNCSILCFTESWLNDDMDNIQLNGFTLHRQDRTAASGKTRGGGLCLFVNNSWCAKSNIKEVSRFCSPEVKYLISCRPHYLPREFIYIFCSCLFTPTSWQ
jgi:uncharacterized membrane protein